jgi:23S rRNA (adenine1618-N6)-methyltransferase
MHPRNRHQNGLDLPALTKASPALARFVTRNPRGEWTLDFADPEAQRALAAALLEQVYGVAGWQLPAGALCPSIPGRADHLLCAAELLAAENRGEAPRGEKVRALDVGVGASCVYPLLGHAEFGWRFVGTDIDAHALAAARRTIAANPGLGRSIELRLQPVPTRILSGLFAPDERFELTLCNPPFHASARQAEESARRKWKKLGKPVAPGTAPPLNFGGQGRELWCPGGESWFLRKLIQESKPLGQRCLWFTALVSKRETLPAVEAALQSAGVAEKRLVEMEQGQKRSRLVAWTFLDASAREAWRAERW